MTSAPPIDHSPQVSSADPADFSEPSSRDEEWRFTPLDDFRIFFQQSPAGDVRAADAPYVSNIPIADLRSTWVASDLPTAVARAGSQQAVLVTIPNDAVLHEPLRVALVASADLAHEHVEIVAGHHARATILIEQPEHGFVSGSIVVRAGDGSQVNLVNAVDGARDRSMLLHVHVQVGRDAHVTSTQVSLGTASLRVTSSVGYDGPGGRADMLGAFLADDGQFMEHRLFVHHDQPQCASNVVYKGALSGASTHTVWVGDVLVRREATAIDTYEINRNLLLTEGARADSVPNLELETGDIVSAGHASATGRFDDDQLFYLQSRGIPANDARQLVVRGFFAEILSHVEDPHWRTDVMARITSRLGMEHLHDEFGHDEPDGQR